MSTVQLLTKNDYLKMADKKAEILDQLTKAGKTSFLHFTYYLHKLYTLFVWASKAATQKKIETGQRFWLDIFLLDIKSLKKIDRIA